MNSFYLEPYYKIYKSNSVPCTDSMYMEQIVNAMYRNYSSNLVCAIKNTNSVYLAASDCFVKTVGMTQENIIGKTELDFPSEVRLYYQEFFNQDRLVEKLRQQSIFLDVHRFENGINAYITRKSPIINPFTNNILGTYLISRILKPNNTNKIIKNLHNLNNFKTTSCQNEVANIYFTQREIEIMFCTSIGLVERKTISSFLSKLHGKSIKHDATIKSTLNSIYNKLTNVNSISGLANYVEQHGINNQIPISMLKLGSFPINEIIEI